MHFKIHRETNKVLENNRYMPDFYICSDKAGCQNHLSGCKDILAGAKREDGCTSPCLQEQSVGRTGKIYETSLWVTRIGDGLLL